MQAKLRIVLLLLLLAVAVLSVFIVTQPLLVKPPPKQRTSRANSGGATASLKNISAKEEARPLTVAVDLSGQLPSRRPGAAFSTANNSTAVIAVPTMSHPSCLAATFLLAHVPGQRRWTGEAPMPLLPQHQYWREYARPEIVCYKHGGHFSPGYPRRGSPRDADALIAPQLRRLVIQGAYFWRGELYVVDGANATQSESFAAYFPYIAASWPQPVVHSITVHHVAALPAAAAAEAPHTVHSKVAVLIPPTDFLSAHHTVVDLVFPLFHLLAEENLIPYSPPLRAADLREEEKHLHDASSGALGGGVDIITARSLWSTNPFEEKSCAVAKERCLNTPFGSLFSAISLASSPEERRQLLHHTLLPSQFACVPQARRTAGSHGSTDKLHNRSSSGGTPQRSQSLADEGTTCKHRRFVYGLGATDDQLKDIPSPSSFGSGATQSPMTRRADSNSDGTLIRVDRLFVGLPSHCDQLWGGDAHFAELVVHHQRLRAPLTDPLANHTLLSRRGAVADPRESIDMTCFEDSFEACQHVLRKFRDVVVESSTRSGIDHPGDRSVGAVSTPSHAEVPVTTPSTTAGPSPLLSYPIVAGPNASVHVVFTSRKGDWARQIHNEDVVVRTLTQHVASKYGPSSTVRSIKFSGSVADQLSASQLDVERTTVFVGNHGANLLNSLYLRPNAGVILLSMGNPGFYPWSVFPDWLHFRDLVVDPFCNVRLRRGKRCRLVQGHLESHVNDMVVTEEKIHLLLRMVDDLILDQQIRPRR